jgi:hypothetical protein
MEAPLAPETMRVLCPACDHRNQQVVINVTPTEEEFHCPKCRKRFGLLTRYVVEARGDYDPLGDYFFDITTIEEGGRLRPRTIRTIDTKARIQPRTWITVVYRADREMGLSDQTHATWWNIPWRRPVPPAHPAVWRITYIAAALLGLIYFKAWVSQAGNSIHNTPGVMIGLIAVAIASLLPLAWWILRAYADDE